MQLSLNCLKPNFQFTITSFCAQITKLPDLEPTIRPIPHNLRLAKISLSLSQKSQRKSEIGDLPRAIEIATKEPKSPSTNLLHFRPKMNLGSKERRRKTMEHNQTMEGRSNITVIKAI